MKGTNMLGGDTCSKRDPLRPGQVKSVAELRLGGYYLAVYRHWPLPRDAPSEARLIRVTAFIIRKGYTEVEMETIGLDGKPILWKDRSGGVSTKDHFFPWDLGLARCPGPDGDWELSHYLLKLDIPTGTRTRRIVRAAQLEAGKLGLSFFPTFRPTKDAHLVNAEHGLLLRDCKGGC